MAKETKGSAGRAVRRSAQSGRFVTAGFTLGPLGSTRLKKSGGSLVATVPAAARNLLQLQEGQDMAVTVEGNRVILEPISTAPAVGVRRPKYTLEELLAGSDPEAPRTEDERAWQDEPPAGREIW